MSNINENKQFQLIADFDGDIDKVFNVEVDGEIGILPLRNMALFPGVAIPCTIGRKSSLRLVKQADDNDEYIGVLSQKNPNVEVPTEDDIYEVGTLAKVVKVFELPDDNHTAILQGFARFKIKKITSTEPYLKAEINVLKEQLPAKTNKEFPALAAACREITERYMSQNSMQADPSFALRNISNDFFLINFICTNLPFPLKEKNDLLQIGSLVKRSYKLVGILNREAQFAALKADIRNKTREDLDKQQKEYFLQQQIKNIQDELGENPSNQDVKDLQDKASKKDMPENIRAFFERELKKLERINPQNPDYNVQLNYLQTLLSLPWNTVTEDDLDLKHATRVLNQQHYGLEKVKERILEHLAILTLRRDQKAPIICLYGPPGVGKTSLGKSIAEALKRKYVRISLGGLHDESEIRGHRRTYIGAMPGRIIKGMIKAGANNPVFILDEIDKISGNNYNGDPASALLEVLDPEQNNNFHDNFLDIDYDLSQVMFIATANSLSTIPSALLDRMELIEVSGYITEEKVEIAKRHLIPKEIKATGLDKLDTDSSVSMSKKALETLVEMYTRESGVRQLEKQINKIMRKVAYRIVANISPSYAGNPIAPRDLKELIGNPPYNRDKYQGNEYAGVVTGLAWTSVGGVILYIETSLSRGKASKLTLTGNLGDVMKESAVLALEYIKAHADKLEIDSRIFENWNIHVHVPEGATPKDGPSAGITIATSLASALTQRKVREKLAMTGEITLRGKVLPVGGIKEKILAAKRAGITDIIISKENKKDIEDIPAIYIKQLTFHYVENVMEVLDYALLSEKVSNAVDLTIDNKKQDENKDNPQD